ncbi:MAG: helix-turn-helix transcriptional regulator [Planctomycetaceae bacterium]|nr:helix-turn-helix transcriptional regulator [Planctomycetaceae bacterium]
MEELANVVGVSPCYFVRQFKMRYGLPPRAYQIQLRLRHARASLADGTPVVEAALKAGFYDQSHFHRHFRRAYGLTPSQYRLSHFSPDN